MTEWAGGWLMVGGAPLCHCVTSPPEGGEMESGLCRAFLAGGPEWAVQRRRGWSLGAGLGGSPGFLPSQE